MPAPEPTAAGTYRYRQSGSQSVGSRSAPMPDEGTLVVDAPSGAMQAWHRYADPQGEPYDTTLRFDGAGMFIVETVIRPLGNEVRCRFDPPLPSPPWPPSVGATFESSGDCGSITAEISGSVTGTKTVELDGRRHDAFVVESEIRTSGRVDSKTMQIDWFVPDLRLSAHTESQGSGSFGAVTFESRLVSDLESAVPA